MAQSIQLLRRSFFSKSQTLLKSLQIHSQILSKSTNFESFQPSFQSQIQNQSRNYATAESSILISAFENNMQRLLRNEADYELAHSPLQQPPSEFNGFKVEECPGQPQITLSKQYGECEKIGIEVTLFDGSVPIPKQGDKPDQPDQEEHLHISMRITIRKGNSSEYFEFICSAWPDTLEIQQQCVLDGSKTPDEQTYLGPIFDELDDELQNSLYDFLEERGIDDNLCEFLHSYIHYKSRSEFIQWTKSVGKVVKKK